MNPITTEQRQKAIRLYRNKEYTAVEIANLLGLSESRVRLIFELAYKTGELEPRRADLVYKAPKPKFNSEKEREIAVDYYEHDMSLRELQAKWGIHPMQLQRIRNKFRQDFPAKQRGRKWQKEKAQKGAFSETREEHDS